eukprot:PhF_6_TR31392/c1_g1_i3/m.45983
MKCYTGALLMLLQIVTVTLQEEQTEQQPTNKVVTKSPPPPPPPPPLLGRSHYACRDATLAACPIGTECCWKGPFLESCCKGKKCCKDHKSTKHTTLLNVTEFEAKPSSPPLNLTYTLSHFPSAFLEDPTSYIFRIDFVYLVLLSLGFLGWLYAITCARISKCPCCGHEPPHHDEAQCGCSVMVVESLRYRRRSSSSSSSRSPPKGEEQTPAKEDKKGDILEDICSFCEHTAHCHSIPCHREIRITTSTLRGETTTSGKHDIVSRVRLCECMRCRCPQCQPLQRCGCIRCTCFHCTITQSYLTWYAVTMFVMLGLLFLQRRERLDGDYEDGLKGSWYYELVGFSTATVFVLILWHCCAV